MIKHKVILGIVLMILGIAGVLSLLTVDIPIPEEARLVLAERLSPAQIKLFILVNPTIFLFIAVLVGTLLYDKARLSVPIIDGLIKGEPVPLKSTLQYGVLGGIIAGILLTSIGVIYYPLLPEAFIEFGNQIKLTLTARFLYGGLTEEILMRFALMTLVVWVMSKLFKNFNSPIYWIGIGIAAIVFAVGHFPIAFQTVESPSVSLLSYIFLGNAVGGIIFGWLYWKKGLESAFIAHIFAHIVMVIAEPLLGI